jgi:alkylation response protein AidB-like acyl-CoA dehydrogenase
MDFDFSDEQEMLRDSVRKWVDRAYGIERRRAITKAGGFSKQAWQELVDLGLPGLQVPEEQGGLGFGPVEAMVVMQELGRGIVLEPFAPVALVAVELLKVGAPAVAEPRLRAIASGEQLVALAHQERSARYRLAHVETKATRSGRAYALRGAKTVVPAGGQASAFIVPARRTGEIDEPSGIGLYLVDAKTPGVSVRAYPTQDGAAAADVVFAGADAEELIAPGEAFEALERALDVGIAAISAEAVGAMDKLFAVTLEYMNTRKQFGVPIATFQALRHRVADVKMQLELARSMSYFATLKLNEAPEPRRRALSQAKVQLGHSMRYLGQQCIQLHGGIGVTDEYLAGHYFKRLTALEMTYGDTLHHLGEVSARMQDTAGVFA